MKFDKVDKIFSCFILIIVTLFCVLNTFCYASTDVELIELNGLSINTNTDTGNNIFVTNGSAVGFYFEPLIGHTYTIKNNLDSAVSFFPLDDIPYSGYMTLNPRTYLQSGKTITYEATNDNIVCVFIGKVSLIDNFSSYIEVYDITPNGFQSVIGNLSLSVGLEHLWSVFDNLVPYVLVVVLFAFGWWFFAHWIKELSKGREF